MTDHQPFTIAIADEAISDLKTRLSHARFSQQIADQPWTLGTDRDTLIDLCQYWQNTFDWRAVELRLNEWPQFVCDSTANNFISHTSGHLMKMPSR